jgi:3',5'-cyclic AMP phosphodiesterase CpdA
VLRILHISDIHFGPRVNQVVVESLVEEANRNPPDLIIASGDFTQRAKIREYKAAEAFLNALPDVPKIVTPGNHDVPLYRVWERVFAPLRNFKDHICEELDTVTRLDGATIVSLNSSSHLRDITNGRIDSWQLRFCRDAFEETPAGDMRIVVAHHPLLPPPGKWPKGMMPRRGRMLRAMEQMGVDLVFGGHLHRGYVSRALDFYSKSKQRYGVWIIQSGTSTSLRGRGSESTKNSFHRVAIDPDSVEVVHHMYFADTHRFERVAETRFPRRGRHRLMKAKTKS